MCLLFAKIQEDIRRHPGFHEGIDVLLYDTRSSDFNFCAETGIFRVDQVNIMSADARLLVSQKTSTAILMTL